MMRFISLLGTALLFPVYGQAKVYDLADITSLNEICYQSSFTKTGRTLYCPTSILLPHGSSIVSSLPGSSHSILKSFSNITLLGNNTIGSPEKKINLRSLSVGVNSQNNLGDNAEYSLIYGSVDSQYSVVLENTLIDGMVNSVGGMVTTVGDYNVINGKVSGSSTVTLNNTNVCGDVESIGHEISINASSNFIVGNINSHSTIELSGADVYGTINSQGESGLFDLGSSSIFAKKEAISSFHATSIQNGTICGTINAHEENIRNVDRYCGISEPNCSYVTPSRACPVPDIIPNCTIERPTEDDFDLVVTPTEDMALMCGDELPQFTVTTTNNGEVTSAQVLASLSHPDLFTLEMVEGKQKIDDSNFISKDDGTLVVKVIPNDIDAISLDSNYTLSFTMIDDMNKAQTVQFMFTPYMFEAYAEDLSSLDEIHVVAGKSETVKTRLLACAATGEQIIATNYDGTPQVTHPLIKPVGGSEGNFSYSAEFKNGLSSHGLITNETGLFSVRLFDTFECTGFQECPDEGSVKVEGAFNVKSRPWTLAICDGSTALASGTSESGPGFIAAGEHFSLTVKPIAWQSGGSLTGEVNTESYCSADVTHNFMLEDAPAASIVLSSKQKTPTETATQTKKLLESTLSLTRSHTESENYQYTFSDLYWEEVGSLKIKAKLDSQYLDMTVNTGYRNVGRFYAKYFKAREAKWTYPTKQDFIYMNQPFERVSYDVVALNAKKEDIQNYVHFNANLREHFHLGELSNYVDRFIPPAAHSVEWNLVGDASVGSFTIEKAAGNPSCDNSPCWEKDATDGKYPDGPFNKDSKSTQSEIGLIHTNVVDEIHFFDDLHILEQQPDVRFGRLNFKDVGGNQGMTIKVPLDVEVWQDGRFVTHFEDSATTANGQHHTRTPIWSNSAPDNTRLSGEGTMLAGRTYDIVASQVDSAREQVRFHLDLSSAGNNLPWLKYNWDKSDADEDNPPTVVTFGIHRGNDRIIYRGEPNFIGMN
ncbi:DUF6701 domain-containing protein [Vibrio owensii]|uniref:DUF6701 domain-containing protein n=1 Tax=Vibrio owensii TaxID=696485 RepID=UPI000996272C|nr:DUF6701 domain-containing protein [Vibrio owensii]AQW60230.1 polymer-forming cytoskeletal family protein [Vibrio owensii]